MISAATASQETSRVEPSPRQAPRISSAIAATASSISGRAGDKSENARCGMTGLGQARAAQACRVGSGGRLCDDMVDRSLDRAQE